MLARQPCSSGLKGKRITYCSIYSVLRCYSICFKNDACLTYCRWEDGKEVKQLLVGLDRWRVHSADRIIVEISGGTIILEQKPLELSAKKLGVGACVWDGAFMMAAYLAEQQSSYEGKRCVEVGAGPGLVGLVLAKLGAEVRTSGQNSVNRSSCFGCQKGLHCEMSMYVTPYSDSYWRDVPTLFVPSLYVAK